MKKLCGENWRHLNEQVVVNGYVRERCTRCGKVNPVGNIPAWIRFWDHVEKTETCWLWMGNKTHDGYGRFTLSEPGFKFDIYAHIYSHLLHRGKMPPPGQEFDHECEARNCVRPEHLRFMLKADNVRRGVCKDVCKRGHDLTLPESFYYYGGPDKKRRRCKLCIPIVRNEWLQKVRPSVETKPPSSRTS